MAPDLNTVPVSPRQQRARTSQTLSTASSRRPSQVVGSSPTMIHSPIFSTTADAGMPIRHPRPMTAAELHLELEKEQEAVVNRLTRELSALRAQHSASVASNASSTTSTTPSLLPIDPSDPSNTGSTHPTPSRRHRSSSSVSTSLSSARAIHTPASTTSSTSVHQPAGPGQGQSQASFTRAANAPSRRPSVSASGRSTPARQSLDHHSLPLPHRPSLGQRDSSFVSTASTHATYGSAGSPAPAQQIAPTSMGGGAGTIAGTGGTAEAERARAELEAVKGENEALKERIRALERTLRSRRESGASEVSYAASAVGQGRVTGPGQVEDRDEVVKVGESAGNAGLR